MDPTILNNLNADITDTTKLLKNIKDNKNDEMLKLHNMYQLINQISNIMDNINLKKKIATPFLKWVGGKTQIIEQILDKMPNKINNYHELFLGGGSVLLGVLSLLNNNKISISGKIYAYDINAGLINVYKQIQTNADEVLKYIQYYINEYDKCKKNPEIVNDKKHINRNPKTKEEAMKCKESFYYWIRKKINTIENNTAEHAGLFIVINKTTFRGMYRTGPNGFNVPYGNYKTTPKMMTKEDITKVSSLIKDVEFICCDFETPLSNIKCNDYIYIDPPYVPENKKSFVGYNIDGFNLEQHIKLFNLIKQQKNIKFCMSNSNVKLVNDAFKDYNISQIKCRRSINAKNPQSTTTELIITNYYKL
jgi:DNA adenine methylase